MRGSAGTNVSLRRNMRRSMRMVPDNMMFNGCVKSCGVKPRKTTGGFEGILQRIMVGSTGGHIPCPAGADMQRNIQTNVSGRSTGK